MACKNCTYIVGAALALRPNVGALLAARIVAVGGERSPSWLAALRCTSVEHLPARSHSPTNERIHTDVIVAAQAQLLHGGQCL